MVAHTTIVFCRYIMHSRVHSLSSRVFKGPAANFGLRKLSNLNKIDKKHALDIVKKLQSNIITSAQTNDKYAD